MLREKGLETNTSLPKPRRQATAGNTSGLRAPQPARKEISTSKYPGPKVKEGREDSGQKGEKERGSRTSLLRKWLTDSGGTWTSGKQDTGGDCEARKRERILDKTQEEDKERDKESRR